MTMRAKTKTVNGVDNGEPPPEYSHPGTALLFGWRVSGDNVRLLLSGDRPEERLCRFRVGRRDRVLRPDCVVSDNQERVERPVDGGLHTRCDGGDILFYASL
jgi:hypothetical protein